MTSSLKTFEVDLWLAWCLRWKASGAKCGQWSQQKLTYIYCNRLYFVPATATIDLSGQRNSTGQNSTAASPLMDLKQKKKRHRRGGPFNRLLRHFKRAKTIGVRNSSCGGLEACTRICVGPNERITNSSDCTTFKIQCTTRVPKGRKKSKGKGKRKNRD